MTKYLITSALPYINGIKHLGNLVGSMLPADVYSRFLRQTGEDVLFICATDELVSAVRASPDDVAVGQKAPVINGINLFDGAFLDIAVFHQLFAHMLSQLCVLVGR